MENREIKFRAWDKRKKRMIYSDDGSWHKRAQQREDIASTPEHNGDMLALFFTYMWRQKIMQYTGLKDKNGKEIYEGDIIKVFDDPSGEIQHQTTTIDEVKQDKYGSWIIGYGYLYDFQNQGEIIGNIYSNPKLVEK